MHSSDTFLGRGVVKEQYETKETYGDERDVTNDLRYWNWMSYLCDTNSCWFDLIASLSTSGERRAKRCMPIKPCDSKASSHFPLSCQRRTHRELLKSAFLSLLL